MNFRAAQSLPSLRLRLSPAARPGRLPSSLLPTRPPSESSLVRRPPFRPLTSHTTGGRGPCPPGTATAGKAKDGQRAEPHWPPRRRQWRGENIHLQAWEGPPRGETKSNSKRFPRTDSLSSAPLRSGGGHGEREAGPQCEWRASPRVRAAGNQGRGTGTEPCLPWTGLMGHATRSFTQAAGRRVCECAGTRGETRSWRDLGAQGRSHGLCMASQRPPGRGPPWSQGAAVA